jgi:hypothetical protein
LQLFVTGKFYARFHARGGIAAGQIPRRAGGGTQKINDKKNDKCRGACSGTDAANHSKIGKDIDASGMP